MATDVIVLKPAHERPALRLPRPHAGRGGGAPGAPVPVPGSVVTGPVSAALPGAGHAAAASTSRWVEVLLTLGSVLGGVVLALTVFAAQTGLRPLVVRSGSMEPTISTGSMVLMREIPASAISPGDVVSVERPDRTRVTHRVMKVEHRGSTAVLTLKGDANEDVDPAPVAVTSAYRLVFSIDAVGRMTAWLATPAGGFALGCLVTVVGMAVLRRRPASASSPETAPAVRHVAI